MGVFAIGLFKNLGNIAFWGDEGETVQLGKSILQFGYPSIFDGRSTFIFVPDRFDNKSYFVYNSPLLQHYTAAIGLKFNNGIADPFIIRFPFALVGFLGVVGSVILLLKSKVSLFAIFLYSFMIATSIQIYLYYRETRHYVFHFPLFLGLIYSYFYLEKRVGQLAFIIFGFLLYNAFYPGFFAIYLSLAVYLLIRKYFLKQKVTLIPFFVCTFILGLLLLPIVIYTKQLSMIFEEQGQGPAFYRNMLGYFYDLNYLAYLKVLFVGLLSVVILKIVEYKKVRFNFLSFRIIPKKHMLFLGLFFVLIPVYTFIISLGRHNARYISLLFPIVFFLTAYFWDYTLSFIGKTKKIRSIIQILSVPIFIYLMVISHPNLFLQIRSYNKELNSTFIGPVDGIVNTITGAPHGRANPYISMRPDLLIATNVESEALYAYLGSQFLDLDSFGVYKYGIRKPDWIIPRHYEGQFHVYDDLISAGNYEKILTYYCDTEFQQIYSVKTHYYETVTHCPERRLVLYKLKSK